MTDFLTRVDLQNATDAEFEALDRAMTAANFSKTMRSPRGLFYNLPQATYFSQADGMTAADVRNLAIAAAQTTGKRYDVITAGGSVAYALHPA